MCVCVFVCVCERERETNTAPRNVDVPDGIITIDNTQITLKEEGGRGHKSMGWLWLVGSIK